MKNSEFKLPNKSDSFRIKILTAIFDFKLERRKIPAFRAAVSEKAGRENVLFHHHLNDGYLYTYPLIQYKTIRGAPAVICISQGSEEILKFFEKPDWDISIHGEQIHTQIRHIGFDYFDCGFSSKPLGYRIWNWFALNESNYKKFNSTDPTGKIEILTRILTGNILSFAKGIGWHIDGNIKISIPKLPEYHLLSFKKHQMTGFTFNFTANMNLPEFIGLGKSVSRGFGSITRRKS